MSKWIIRFTSAFLGWLVGVTIFAAVEPGHSVLYALALSFVGLILLFV